MATSTTPFRRQRVLLAAGLAAAMVASPFLVSSASAHLAGDDEAAVTAPAVTATPTGGATPPDPAVNVEVAGFLSWAALDRATGQLATSGDDDRNTTESMIKVWVVADALRRHTEAGTTPEPPELEDARAAIRDSADDGAQRLYLAGGGDRVVERMIDICGLTDTEVTSGWWSRTTISAPDAVRLGACLADGRAAGPEWTDWVLAEMRQVRGSTAVEDQPLPGGGEGGRWGIIDGLPAGAADEVAIKNGWTRIEETGNWHLNCLGITDDWVLAVVMQYPAEYSLDYGARRCAEVTAQVVGEQADPAALR